MTPFLVSHDLKRYPHRKGETLQAWDSADELILEHLSGIDLVGKRILILCDQFGALSSALRGLQITTYTDSYVSARAIQLNTQGKVNPINNLGQLSETYDYVLIRIPKTMSFFEDILCHLSGHLDTNSKIICGSMLKHLAKSSFDLLGKIIGDTSTSLAKKKARLVFVDFKRSKVVSPYPKSVAMEGFRAPFSHESNLFSGEKLDIGTRFLLEHLPSGISGTILDLGSGNGIVGIAAKKINPKAQIIFCDDSAMAIKSSEANYGSLFQDHAHYEWTNCYENQSAESVDLVLCNPPFHQGTTIGDFIAWQMFQDAHYVLKKGGRIRVIGNSHLLYQQSLKKIFGGFQILATNQKFMIVDSQK